MSLFCTKKAKREGRIRMRLDGAGGPVTAIYQFTASLCAIEASEGPRGKHLRLISMTHASWGIPKSISIASFGLLDKTPYTPRQTLIYLLGSSGNAPLSGRLLPPSESTTHAHTRTHARTRTPPAFFYVFGLWRLTRGGRPGGSPPPPGLIHFCTVLRFPVGLPDPIYFCIESGFPVPSSLREKSCQVLLKSRSFLYYRQLVPHRDAQENLEKNRHSGHDSVVPFSCTTLEKAAYTKFRARR